MADRLTLVGKRLFESLSTDLKQLSVEAKRKHHPVKEAAETCSLKLRMIVQKTTDFLPDLLSCSSEICTPFIMGCDTRNPKIVNICLSALQRMVQHQVISAHSADLIMSSLCSMMDTGIEELKILQTTILMITTNNMVQHDQLARALVLSFRLYFTKDSTTINTAGATIRQLVFVVYERVIAEDSIPTQQPLDSFTVEKLKSSPNQPPESLRPCAQDGFMLFQDLCQLVNADAPLWLRGITEMTRTFGLELLESVMSQYPTIFHQHEEFAFLLKERVCPLVIKLFSPSVKYKQGLPHSTVSPQYSERPYFPITMRLLRIVLSLIKDFYSLHSTECEIFISMLIKFMDVDKPLWQRCVAAEVLMKICTDPKLLRSFVECYDIKEHGTKVFQQIVNAIGSFVQTLFASAITSQSHRGNEPKTPDTQGAPPALVGGLPVGGGVTPQPAFVYKGVWIPLIMNVPQTTLKPLYLDMMDKLEPPAIPEGYPLTLGFASLLDLTHSIELNVLKSAVINTAGQTDETSEDNQILKQLIESSWCGVLASFSLLLDASTDEQATAAILKSEETFVMLSGLLKVNISRDAFVTALCKSSLPPHYAMLVLSNPGGKNEHKTHVRVPSFDGKFVSTATDDNIDKNQVVAIGTPLPTPNMPATMLQQQVCLTSKNISCMRAILSLAHCHGAVLGHSWDIILTTLQHLVWILGLKAVSGGELKTEKAVENQSAVITTAIMSEIPAISVLLTKLFENSKQLDDVAVHHLVNALCKLSNESMELAFNNREPSLFAVAKIHETGMANLHRIEILWRPLTGHLLEVCQHPHAAMRACGVEAVTSLVLSALQYEFDPPLTKNERLLSLLLEPLDQLSTVSYIDVRQSQMECALKILQNCGESLGSGWTNLLKIIGDGASLNGDETEPNFNSESEVVVRKAFDGIQLIVTDFLPIISCKCLLLCVEMAAKFGLQQTELNVSLTAIGLLWNISDFFYQQRDRLASATSRDDVTSDQLWLCLYTKFSELCVDPRPAVRKSAGQTLFSTITAHGDLLQISAWQNLLSKVLFPLLERVRENLEAAPTQRETSGPDSNILMHHSRDTASKQWSETQVLITAGVTRVFSSKKPTLQKSESFEREWAFMLQYIEKCTLTSSAEVSIAALKSFLELVSDSSTGNDSNIQTPSIERREDNCKNDDSIWLHAWKVWLSIGLQRTTAPKRGQTATVPSQSFLCHLIQIFSKIYQHILHQFVPDMFQQLCTVLNKSLLVPLAGDTSPFLVPTNYDTSLTPVQEAVLQAYDYLIQNIEKTHAGDKLYPQLIVHLIRHSETCIKPPQFGDLEVKPANTVKGLSTGYIASDMTEFSEKTISMSSELYTKYAHLQSTIQEHTLKLCIQSLHVVVRSRNTEVPASLWKLAIDSLIQAVKIGLPLTFKYVSDFTDMWSELSSTIADILFPIRLAAEELSLSEFKENEKIDCRIIEMIGSDILTNSSKCPPDFINKIVQLLNKGSILSQQGANTVGKVRHTFTQKCFETLLKFSFATGPNSGADNPPVTQVAVRALLSRCSASIKQYTEDLKHSGAVPIARSQVNEVTSSIKAVSTLITSLKSSTRSTSVDSEIWKLIIDMYPTLVTCIHSKSELILQELDITLKSYQQLLTQPTLLSHSTHVNLSNGL